MILITDNPDVDAFVAGLDEVTREWESRAALGECGWICADCCASFAEGMPNDCAHGLQWCTDIITRQKQAAKNGVSK